jgi:hypothetical protein
MTEKALESAARVADLTDDEIALVTDRTVSHPAIDHRIEVQEPSHDLRDKVRNSHRGPFSEVLYLDADTYVCDAAAIEDLFSLLERFDCATAADSARRLDEHLEDGTSVPDQGVPHSFPEPNTGVMVYDADACEALFERWRTIYDRHYERIPGINDQGAFHQAVYETDVSVGTLPAEFNFRLIEPHYVRKPVRILHGYASNFEEIERAINRHVPEDDVVYYPIEVNPFAEAHTIRPLIDPGSVDRFLASVRLSLADYGLFRTALHICFGGGTDLRAGYRRRSAIRDSITEDGIATTVRRMIDWARGGTF